jgi:hypothetical protein
MSVVGREGHDDVARNGEEMTEIRIEGSKVQKL